MIIIKAINIGTIIMEKRKEKQVTQEGLAQFLNVSKAAVSKWESGKSYPDITLLPVIANFFSITVDDLLGYEPQLTNDQIRVCYSQLADAFTRKPFAEAYEESEAYLKKYYVCWPFQFYIGLLYVNYSNTATKASGVNLFLRADEIFTRVIAESGDLKLSRQSLALKGTCLLSLGQVDEAILLLEEQVEYPSAIELILAQCYGVKGENDKTKGLLQSYLYNAVMGIINSAVNLMSAYRDDLETVKAIFNRALGVADLFEVEVMQPSSLLTNYFVMASISTLSGDREETLMNLEKYATLATDPNLFPIELKGNRIFDALDTYFDALALGKEPPRSEVSIKESIKTAVLGPEFDFVKNDIRYKQVLKKIEKI